MHVWIWTSLDLNKLGSEQAWKCTLIWIYEEYWRLIYIWGGLVELPNRHPNIISGWLCTLQYRLKSICWLIHQHDQYHHWFSVDILMNFLTYILYPIYIHTIGIDIFGFGKPIICQITFRTGHHSFSTSFWRLPKVNPPLQHFCCLNMLESHSVPWTS